VLNGYLSDLSEKYLAPLLLYYFEKLSYKEISEVLKIPVSTVGVRLKRGREKLKEVVENDKRF
jgi:RNA polymerase sigma-70 factor (ECF subfamily)